MPLGRPAINTPPGFSTIPGAQQAIGNIRERIQALEAYGLTQQPGAAVATPVGAATLRAVQNQIDALNARLAVLEGLVGDGGPVVEPAPDSNTVTALIISGGDVVVDLELGDYFTLLLTENVFSFTFIGLPGFERGFSKWIEIRQHPVVAMAVTLTQFEWAGGLGTTAVSTVLGAKDVLALTSSDDGSTIQATLAKDWRKF